jgi:PmbA protein
MTTELDSGTAPQPLDRLRAALAATPGAHDWQIDLRAEREAQLYLIGRQVEERRTVINTQAIITLYNDHPPRTGGDTPMRGSARLTLTSPELANPAQIAARLQEAVAIAGLTDNLPFALPGQLAGGFPAIPVADPALSGDLGLALEAARERLEASMAGQREVRLASAELYATRGHRTLENSRGLRGAYEGTRLYLDLVLIASGGIEEAEHHIDMSRRRLDDLNFAQVIPAYATFARDVLRATTPATHRGPVILSGWALTSLFGPLIAHTSAQTAYQGISRLEPGAPISTTPPRGDRITLAGDRTRPFGMLSAPFDGEGFPAARLTVIQDGIMRARWGDARYASYVGIPPTGDFGNVCILPGSTSLEALRNAQDGPLYEVVAFSWMRPDPLTGAFVSEIKLGYRHEPGGHSIPIKGGSLTGNLFTALGDVQLSAELYSDGTYHGPAAMRFGELTISGV